MLPNLGCLQTKLWLGPNETEKADHLELEASTIPPIIGF